MCIAVAIISVAISWSAIHHSACLWYPHGKMHPHRKLNWNITLECFKSRTIVLLAAHFVTRRQTQCAHTFIGWRQYYALRLFTPIWNDKHKKEHQIDFIPLSPLMHLQSINFFLSPVKTRRKMHRIAHWSLGPQINPHKLHCHKHSAENPIEFDFKLTVAISQTTIKQQQYITNARNSRDNEKKMWAFITSRPNGSTIRKLCELRQLI